MDQRFSRVIYEHERIFTQMIDAFLDEKEKKEFIICADQNLHRAELVHMLGLKMGFTGETSLIHRISGYIDEIIESEKQYIPELLDLLKIKYAKTLIQSTE